VRKSPEDSNGSVVYSKVAKIVARIATSIFIFGIVRKSPEDG
jgi:hypothetical protein